MNETELEVAISDILKKYFPALEPSEISNQDQFSIRLGRDKIKIQGSKSTKKGRSDILIKRKGTNLAIFELKRPDKELDDDDRDQGLSYARLCEPMAPIVIISNGRDTKFFQTHDGKPWKPEADLEKGVQDLVKSACKLGEQSMDEAVKTLMGFNPDVWTKAVDEYSKNEIEKLSGAWLDLEFPFINNFYIKRDASCRIKRWIDEDESTIVLTGLPLSGKSNVIRGLIEEAGEKQSIFYFSASDSAGPFQEIANALSDELFRQPNVDFVREWLRRGRLEDDGHKLILVIDDVSFISEELRSNLNELVKLVEKGKNICLLLSLTDDIYRDLTIRPGRIQRTRLAINTKVLELDFLSDREFSHAAASLSQKRIILEKGCWFNEEFRWPRFFRFRVGTCVELNEEGKNQNDGLTLHGVTSLEFLESAKTMFSQNEGIRIAYTKLAQALLDQPEECIGHELKFKSLGAISRDVAESYLGIDFDNSLKSGLIRSYTTPDNSLLILPAFLECLLYSSALLLENELLGEVENADFAKLLISKTRHFPRGEIIATWILCRLIRKSMLPVQVLYDLLEEKPTSTEVVGGTKVRLFDQNFGDIDVNFEKKGEGLELSLDIARPDHKFLRIVNQLDVTSFGSVLDNYAYLVLSHFLQFPFSFDNTNDRFDNTPFFVTICAQNTLIRAAPSFPLETMKPFISCGYGESPVPSDKNGIIEPITTSLACVCRDRPELLLEMANIAIDLNSFPLIYRLYHAASFLSNICQIKEAFDVCVRIRHFLNSGAAIQSPTDLPDGECQQSISRNRSTKSNTKKEKKRRRKNQKRGRKANRKRR